MGDLRVWFAVGVLGVLVATNYQAFNSLIDLGGRFSLHEFEILQGRGVGNAV